jgi:hypothetical protein
MESVAAVGPKGLAALVGQRCAQGLECSFEPVVRPALVEIPDTLSDDDIAAALPCAGLLLESVVGAETMDFENPRRAPDTAAATRQRVLLGVLGAIVLAGGSWLWASTSLSKLDGEIAQLQKRQGELKLEVEEHLVRQARLAHIEQWSKARVDWLAFLDVLNQQLPEAKLAVLDGLGGTMDANIAFASKGKAYPDGTWSVAQESALTMDGRMAERKVAADLRGKLLDLPFDSVESKGADVPDRFSFVLKTSLPLPKKPEPPVAAPAQKKAEQKAPSQPAPKTEGAK